MNFEKQIHPIMIWNKKEKIKSKIGAMLMDLVIKENPAGAFEYAGIVELCKKYSIHPDTLHKYLGQNIETDIMASNKKKLCISKNEVTVTRELIHIANRYMPLNEKEKKYIKYLLIHIGKIL